MHTINGLTLDPTHIIEFGPSCNTKLGSSVLLPQGVCCNLNRHQMLAIVDAGLHLCGDLCWHDSFVFWRLISAGGFAYIPMKLGVVSTGSVDFVVGVD